MRGAKYRKADLQIHTPASKCYEEKQATADQIIEAALQRGLDIIAITDHNTTEFIEKVREAAKGKSVHVFPGVEITTAGGHILAVFDRDCPVEVLNDLLARVGILADMRGDVDAIGADVETVIREVDGLGGIAIAAHANSSSGILKNPQGQHRIKLCSMPELSALEFTSEQDVKKFTAGLVQGYPKKACVQDSDAHRLTDIGQRFTYLKMDLVSLNGIRQALLDHEIKVKFVWDDIALKSPRIVSLSVSQGFFDGERFELHPHLNCFVGGKGTGKSTVIELIRYAFNDLPSFQEMRDDTLGKALSLVGPGGMVEVHCTDELGQEFTVRRQVTEDHSKPPECYDANDEISSLPLRPVFFSQGEVVRVATSPLAQMKLIDSHVDIEQPDKREAEALALLEKNAIQISQAEERIARLLGEVNDPKSGKKVTEAEVKKLEQALKDPVLKEFPKWEGEQRFVNSRLAALDSMPTTIQEAFEAVEIDDAFTIDLPPNAPNEQLLEPLNRLPGEIKKLIRAKANELRKRLSILKKEAGAAVKRWEAKFGQKRTEHEQLIAKSKEKTLAALQAKLAATQRRLEKLSKAEKDAHRVQEQRQNHRQERSKAIASIKTAREERFNIRTRIAKRWQAALGNKIRIDLVHLGDREEYAAKLKELLKGSYVQEKDERTVVKALDPWTLVRAATVADVPKVASAGVAHEVAKRIIEFLAQKPQGLLALEAVRLPDLPQIAFEVEPGVFKPLNALSVGGKGTVIILLAMIEGSAPLLVDQPEDSLDTLFIYEQIVKKVREQKELRQFIFATHNANVLVSADADLSFVLEASADKGTVRSHGGIDRKDTNELLVIHLEGGEAAFKVRGLKYKKS